MFKRFKQLFRLEEELAQAESKKQTLLAETYDLEQLKERTVSEALRSIKGEKEQLEKEVETLTVTYEQLTTEIEKAQKKARSFQHEAMGIRSFVQSFPDAIDFSRIEQPLRDLEESFQDGLMDSVVTLHLHHHDSKALRKEMTANNRLVRKVLKQYESRYTTKANIAIYQLMVIGLQSELQNILYTLTYSKQSKAVEQVDLLIAKYQDIAANGNASILPTIIRFLADIHPLFHRAVEIEFEYHLKKEQEKEEQRRIKEIMKQEAEERKKLEEERKKLEREEEKFQAEITKANEMLQGEQDETKIQALMDRIAELSKQVDELEEQKEEIVKRANGRAGYVYVISNLGSFGEHMFKVGMTRRLNPQDRIDELGNASVPFRFDVHALVFSDNAVGLEQAIHDRLQHRRVNRVNLRKEYFYTDVNELESIVQDIDPTVEFIPTMAALEYQQSESLRERERETTETREVG